MTRRLAILTAALLLAATTLQAKVTFPSVISDNMVLQQQTAAALWGKAEPGRKVTVQPSWTKTRTVTTADPKTGKWEVRPFYFVQIAPYPYDNPDSFMSGYFYEAQQKSLSVIPGSGMAVTCDIGEYGTIHPCQKETVGKRLAYLALNHDYGYKIVEADAPTYKSVKFENGKAKVSFNVGNRGLSPIGSEISGFEIAGEDKVFHPAKATFEEDDNSIVTVSSDKVANPAAVRYCFRNWCVGGLYNNFGIPAAPFRTDNWDL